MFLTTQFLLFSYLFYIAMTRHLDFRERFLERKLLRTLQDQRIAALNKYGLKNTEMLDDITHYRKIKGKILKASKKVRAIEKDFRRLLAMDGMKYNYKRDLYWRTWRSMPPVNNVTNQIVNYKCNNPIYVNGAEYQNCGMWTIEEQPPPCPYEFFSVISDEKLCGANYTQYKDVNNTCSSIIKFSDMAATCDNPIETQFRFTKMYGVTQKYKNVICKNKDFCDILTLYEIAPEYVVFRIVNSTNDVIYSRIMKPKNKNYICVNDCGRFNPYTKRITKADKPLKLDLLVPRKLQKAKALKGMSENVTKRNIVYEINESVTRKIKLNEKKIKLNEVNDNETKKIKLNEVNENVSKKIKLNEVNENVSKKRKLNDVNESMIKKNMLNELDDSETKKNTWIETDEIVTESGHFLEELDASVTKTDVSYENRNVMHGPTKVKKMREILNEIPPVEEHMSESKNDFIIVSIEESVLHKVKSRRKKNMKSNLVSTGVSVKPTVTPGLNLWEGGLISIEELGSEDYK